MQRRIVCAAMRNKDGVIICGARHYDTIMRQQIKNSKRSWLFWRNLWASPDQGFIDQFGVFLNRTEARVIAEAAGQIIRRCGGDKIELYSENLY